MTADPFAWRNTPIDDPEWPAYGEPSNPTTRCTDGCLAAQRRWPEYVGADSDSVTCYRCKNPVCASCGTGPVESAAVGGLFIGSALCDACSSAGEAALSALRRKYSTEA